MPIHLTTSFVFESSDHAAALFNLERAGHVYSRISNPTDAVLEQRVSALEGGIGAITTASGQAALHLSIATLMGAGSHIVAMHRAVRRLAEPAALHDAALRHRDHLRQAAATSTAGAPRSRPETRLLFGETRRQPRASTCSTSRPWPRSRTRPACRCWSTPPSPRPTCSSRFDCGADLVYHSATKFLWGHGTVIGGVVVDGGSFDWETSGSFAELTQAYDGFHNMVFSEESTVGAFLLRARAKACATSAPR